MYTLASSVHIIYAEYTVYLNINSFHQSLQTLMSARSQVLVTTPVVTQKEATPVLATLDTLSQGVQDV